MDIDRGWGVRPSVANDYLFDQPVMLGSQRIGQDLMNIGSRQTNAMWHFMHLYDPRSVSPGSVMPRYRYLFEKRKIKGEPAPDALPLGDKAGASAGNELVPKQDARALVAYLLSLEAQIPVLEAPLPQPKSETNQAPAQVSTNAPPPAPAQPPK